MQPCPPFNIPDQVILFSSWGSTSFSPIKDTTWVLYTKLSITNDVLLLTNWSVFLYVNVSAVVCRTGDMFWTPQKRFPVQSRWLWFPKTIVSQCPTLAFSCLQRCSCSSLLCSVLQCFSVVFLSFCFCLQQPSCSVFLVWASLSLPEQTKQCRTPPNHNPQCVHTHARTHTRCLLLITLRKWAPFKRGPPGQPNSGCSFRL